MRTKRKTISAYVIAIVVCLFCGVLSAWVNAVKMDLSAYVQPKLSPPAWLFSIVWTILYVLMGISAARVSLSCCGERADALFLNGIQLLVNFLWTVFFFSFSAFMLSFFWLLFLLLLVILTAVRFERCVPGAGKLQLPYILWLCFAAYLNLSIWMLNR